jgi:hypothetical protein
MSFNPIELTMEFEAWKPAVPGINKQTYYLCSLAVLGIELTTSSISTNAQASAMLPDRYQPAGADSMGDPKGRRQWQRATVGRDNDRHVCRVIAGR